MPGETDIEIGDSEESAVDVALPAEGEETPQKPLALSNEASSQNDEEELDEYSGRVKTRIDQLTNRFREEERQKQTAIQFAENVHLENESLKQRLGSLDRGYQEQFGGRVTSEIDLVKKSLKDAHESGDIDKIVEAQESMSNLAYQKGRLEAVQGETAAYDAQAQAAYAQAAYAQPAAQAQPAAPPPDPKAQEWASRNDWFGQDEVMTYAAFGLHRKLVEEEGFDPQANEYYSELDKRLATEFPHKLGAKSKSNGGGRRVASAEASASRNKGGRKTVRLTPSQVAIAKRLNVPLEEYAKYVRD
jgi:hypothetical protein